MRRYSVTYGYNGYLRGKYHKCIDAVTDAIEELQAEDVDVEFLGATQEINGAGQLVEVTVRFAAPTKGTLGRLNCRGCLPACGPPRRLSETEQELSGRRVAAATS